MTRMQPLPPSGHGIDGIRHNGAEGEQDKRVVQRDRSGESPTMTPFAHETAGVVTPPNSPETPLIEDYVVSFASFYASNYRRAVALAAVLTGSQAVAEDLVQDAMADAHRRWHKISTYEKPSAWLNQAVANRAVSRRRRLTVRARGLSLLARSPKPPVELVPNDQELWAKVRQLPARQAQLIALVYVEAMTLSEAADTLGIALPTAKTHLARAKERLARDLIEWRNP
jgi:RNA polymerase sigma-70 factor, ECF subfamily